MSHKIIPLNHKHLDQLAPLIAEFRVTLRALKGRLVEPDLQEGQEEGLDLLENQLPIYGIFSGDTLAGYLVLKIESPAVWVEQIFVHSNYRRMGFASLLFEKAEQVAEELGCETLFNCVHPNNDQMFAFLRAHGYTVLNLVEVRKPFSNEKTSQKIKLGNQEFDY